MKPNQEDLRVATNVVKRCVERAKRVDCDCEDLWCGHWIDKVAAEFASAIAAEREKAAKIAEAHYDHHKADDAGVIHAGQCHQAIAAAIKAGDKECET